MITVLSDTHGIDDHRLDGRTLEAVRTADLVLHAGDFTTATVLDAFVAEAGSGTETETETGKRADARAGNEHWDGDGNRFVAVAGNNDEPTVRERLDETGVVEWGGVRFVVVHGHRHDETTLSLLGRQEDADVVVVGHSHRSRWDPSGSVAVLNPGSHADPRRHRPAHAELEPTAEGLSGRLVTPDGEVLEAFEFAVGRV